MILTFIFQQLRLFNTRTSFHESKKIYHAISASSQEIVVSVPSMFIACIWLNLLNETVYCHCDCQSYDRKRTANGTVKTNFKRS